MFGILAASQGWIDACKEALMQFMIQCDEEIRNRSGVLGVHAT